MSKAIFAARLKAKFNTSGKSKLSNERIDAFADRLHKKNPDLKDDDEKGHDEKIDELNEVVDFSKIATDDDRLRTAEAKLKESQKASQKKTSTDEEEEDEEDDDDSEEGAAAASKKNGQEVKKKKERIPSYAKAIMEKLERLEKKEKTMTIQEKIKGHEKLKNIPAEFYEDYVQPEKEEDIDAFAEKVATKYSTFKQVNKNEKATSLTRPVSANADSKDQADVKEVDKLLDEIMPGTKAPAAAK